ncbi:MAG TPA: HAMP domain-containing sensor histidine kinase, partial [Pyrinomonadaceae bacterium]|nr:HAMP domain-containing sensor histidine kinase [Pyrinomonadaceae bacterium]
MSKRTKNSGGIASTQAAASNGRKAAGSAVAPAATVQPHAAAETAACDPASEFHALGAEVVDLLHTQAFAAGESLTEADICEAFSEILLRHWDLCCILIFLQADDGHLHESAIHTHPHLDTEKARRVGELMAGTIEKTAGECQVWLDELIEGCDDDKTALRDAFIEAGLKAGLAVPIHARGSLAGAVIAVTHDPERLRLALQGVRFIAAPIVIAVGNARRGVAMDEQRRHIERLIEELRERGDALEEANRELQRVGRYRSLFLARMSHELRTPLTSILGFAEILLDQERLTDQQRRFCQKIQASGQQLQASLNQLVDLSRLEAGHTELFLHEFSLREMLRDSCAAVARLAQKQEATLDCDAPNAPSTVVSDEGKLRQVLYNFLAYAISRSPAGGRVRVGVGTKSGHRFRIDITDEGEPLADPAHLFEPVDIDAPNERGTNMNELGLVIAHRLLRALGGSVTLIDAKPTGLTVRLDLPT